MALFWNYYDTRNFKSNCLRDYWRNYSQHTYLWATATMASLEKEMNLGIFLQISVTVIGASAVFMVGRKKRWYKYGYVVGMCSQILWLALFLYYQQYFMLPQILLYGSSWYLGYRSHFK